MSLGQGAGGLEVLTVRPISMTESALFLFTAALLFLSLGCRNSAKTGSPTPSPTPSAVLTTSTPPTGPAVTVPVKTFQVQPPASFPAEQLREGNPIAFMVQGNAGQFLRVKINAEQGAQLPVDQYKGNLFSVKVLAPETGAEVEAGAEDCAGLNLYSLPLTGAYRVVFDRGGERLGIAFTLFDYDDRVVGPGMKPEEFSLDFGVFPRGQFAAVPHNVACGAGDETWPSHLALKGSRFELRIMPTRGIDGDESKELQALRAALRSGEKDADAKRFPYPESGDSALMLATRPKLIQANGWRGMRWLGAFAQDSGCGFAVDGQGLAYVFEGISDDDRFFILMRTGISNNGVAARLDKDCTARAGRDFDTFFEREMPAMFDKAFSAANPASFTPNLDQLDAIIKSLKLKH